jgi:trehalose/maltose hydrolase-like predicted phosphorylase
MAERSLGEWEVRYLDWDAAEQPLREALTTLGNGYFATRGAGEEVRAGGPHYPGTYLAGGFNRLESEVAGKMIENEDLVNWPNWLYLTFRIEEGEWFDLDRVSIQEYEQRLDLRRAVLERRVRFRDDEGRESLLESRRIVHMEDPHVAAIEWTLTPLDWTGRVEIHSAIDARVTNTGVARYRDLSGKHLKVLSSGPSGEDAVCLLCRTTQSHLAMALAARTHLTIDGQPAAVERRAETTPELAGHYLSVTVETKKPICVEKVVTLYTSRDHAISEPRLAACTRVHRLPGFAELLERHQRAWRYLWSRADLELADHDIYPQAVLRLHIFHLLQTTSLHTIEGDFGIPARGLHGEAYRGHIFWDEVFTFPFLNFRIPEITRALLMYRYRRLGEARHAAREAGYEGAMFPWQSGSDGREETQVVHLNPESGRWLPDNTHRQRHVNAAIAYNLWQYHQATDDLEFLSFYGAEMLLEIARFWASLAAYDAERERYVIEGVVGPDEFHTRYPGSESLGLKNNAYTNVMAAWVLKTARAALDLLPPYRRREVLETLGIGDQDLRRWDEISRRIFVPFQGEGIISQFEGWDDLEELDWEGLKERHGDIQRLDRILEAEGDDPNRYKATKQADVLMLFYLFSAEELGELFERLGYELRGEQIPRNVRYYLDRTSHGSTLSRIVHSWVLARMDRKGSWNLFQNALASDIDDVQGGTTPEGIHLGAMAGTVDLVERGYAGLEMREDVLWLNPQLPDALAGLKLCVRYRGHWISLAISREALIVRLEPSLVDRAARIGVKGEVFEIEAGQQRTFRLAATAPHAGGAS